MKKLVLFIIVCYLTLLQGYAQSDQNYLFEEFEKALIIFKDNRRYNAKVNYDLVSNKFLFIDAYDEDVIKEFADFKNLSTLIINNRIFYPKESGAIEVLQTRPVLQVKYKGFIRAKYKESGYGGKSALSSSTSYSSMSRSGKRSELKKNGETLIKVRKEYIINKQGKDKIFSNEKQFLKLFPSQQNILQQYMKEKETDFNNIPDVIELYNYAESL